MRPPTSLILAFLVLKAVDGYFDCRRRGLSCEAGGCNLVDGNCACPVGVNGTDCGLKTSLANKKECTLDCENGGTCLLDDKGSRCYCPEVYTGLVCEIRRAAVECTGSNMTITVSPYKGFKGIVYVNGQQENGNCTFDGLKYPSGVEYFMKTFSLDDGCSAIVKANTPNNGDHTYEREIIIQYNPNMQTALDQFLNISCVHKADDVTTLTSNVDSLQIENRGNLTKDNTSTVYAPVKLEIQNRDGSDVEGAVFVGRPLRLYFSLNDFEVYDNLKVEECYALNGLIGTDKKKESLIEKSCRHPDARQIIRDEIEQDDEKGIVIKFDVFKFIDSKVIEFECNVRVCKPGDKTCDPEVCDGDTNIIRNVRQKREASLASEDHVVVKDKLYVTDIVGGQRTQPAKNPRAHECLEMTEILSIVIILGAAALVFMLVSCCLILCLVRNKRHNNKVAASKISESEMSTTTTSVSSERVRIPRIHSLH